VAENRQPTRSYPSRVQNIRIDAIRSEDAGEVLTLQRAAYVSEARIYHDPQLPALTQTLPELEAELAAGLGLAARCGHRIVGAVRARLADEVIHIGRLTVAPDWQGRGLGARLLAEMEASAPARITTAALFTGHLSEANLRLYARCGYQEQRREELKPGLVLIHLTKQRAAERRQPA
jgi:GNAT superfamily N-acetyltransferase